MQIRLPKCEYFPMKSSGKICIFTDKGQMHTVRAGDLPLAGRTLEIMKKEGSR